MNYNDVYWGIDERLMEAAYSSFPTLDIAAENLGCKVIKTKYIPFSDEINNFGIPDNSCVISYGSIEFIKRIQRNHKTWCPGTYLNNDIKQFSYYASYLYDYMLNSDYYFIPWGEFIKRGLKENEEVFIKPNSGLKTFTGKVITYENFHHETNSMKQIETIDANELCVISSVKPIDAEFRYIIVDGKVITGSEYRWDNILDVRIDTLPICDDLAKLIADHEYQADTCYVCDIAYTERQAKIIELNAFSCSGLYACDTDKIVKAVS